MQDNSKPLMTCSYAKALKRKYVKGQLKDRLELREDILRHLCRCKECRLEYIQENSNINGTTFNIYKEIKDLINAYKDANEDNDVVIDSQIVRPDNENYIDFFIIFTKKPSYYWKAAISFNVDKLMKLQVFRDLWIEFEDTVNNEEGDDTTNFVRYLICNITKDIDHLEKCYYKEMEKKK